jgi:hypothetical protein
VVTSRTCGAEYQDAYFYFEIINYLPAVKTETFETTTIFDPSTGLRLMFPSQNLLALVVPALENNGLARRHTNPPFVFMYTK